MDRRTFVKWAGSSAIMAGSAFAGITFGREIAHMGAVRPLRPKRDRKHFHNTFSPFKGVSGYLGFNVFLYQNLQKTIGEIKPHDQSTIVDVDGKVLREGEGDCVGHSAAMGCDVLAATNIHMLKQREQFVAKASVEMLYAGSRVEVGGGAIGGRAGSHGEWVARFLKEYGVLHRLEYANASNYLDLRGYNPERSRKYRDDGVPDWLEDFARKHPVREITNVHSAAEALDAVCAGQPVIMCSSYAFPDERDKEGFTKPYLGVGWTPFGRGRVRQWWHAMVLTGAILEGKRKGGVIQNSHGVWNHGPRPNNMPEGSFGVEMEYLDLMVKDWFDCYAISSYTGHHARRMRHQLYLK